MPPLLVLALLAACIGFLTSCEVRRHADTPTAVAAAATATPRPSDTPLPPTDTPLPPTATPVPPTDTPLPPTATPPPTDTPLPPTDTPVPPTDTPPPTATPLPPTDTPVPPTQTPVPPTRTPAPPTDTPPPPPPTQPPAPQFPWRGQVAGTFSNCALTRVMGLTLDRNGGIAGDIWVHFWADGWGGDWALSSWAVNEGYPGLEDSSNWDGSLAPHPKAGTWYACVAPADGSWDCISPTVTAQTVLDPCGPGSGGVQIVRIVFQQN